MYTSYLHLYEYYYHVHTMPSTQPIVHTTNKWQQFAAGRGAFRAQLLYQGHVRDVTTDEEHQDHCPGLLPLSYPKNQMRL